MTQKRGLLFLVIGLFSFGVHAQSQSRTDCYTGTNVNWIKIAEQPQLLSSIKTHHEGNIYVNLNLTNFRYITITSTNKTEFCIHTKLTVYNKDTGKTENILERDYLVKHDVPTPQIILPRVYAHGILFSEIDFQFSIIDDSSDQEDYALESNLWFYDTLYSTPQKRTIRFSK